MSNHDMPTREMLEGTRLHNEIEDGLRQGKSLASILEAFEPKEPMPFPNYTGSLAEQIRLLAVGKSAAKVEAIDFDAVPAKGDSNMLLSMREQIRNSLASAVARAKETTGGTYSIEVGETCMPAGSIYITAVITRTA